MISAEQKKTLKELSSNVIRYVMDEIESSRADEMMDDISFTLSMYLKEIVEMTNPTLSELAMRMKRSKPSVTLAIDKLEKKGYVKRVQADEDRRSFHIHLTDKGKHFNEVQKKVEDKFNEKMSAALNDEELIQMIELSKKMFG